MDMDLRRLCVAMVVAAMPVIGFASLSLAPSRISSGAGSLAARESHIWPAAVHESQYATLIHAISLTGCGASQPPQALATPDPLMEDADLSSKVSVSFIIGTDGRVHNPRVVRSLGMGLDEKAIEGVKTWKFDPSKKDGRAVAVEMNIEVAFNLY